MDLAGRDVRQRRLAGKDHHTAGGSWETAAPIAAEVFGTPPPATLKFDWINVRGVGTMASSSGQMISVADALTVYQPEVVRYLFARTRPTASSRSPSTWTC